MSFSDGQILCFMKASFLFGILKITFSFFLNFLKNVYFRKCLTKFLHRFGPISIPFVKFTHYTAVAVVNTETVTDVPDYI